MNSFVFTLYDSDGTIWWRANLINSSPDYFGANKKKKFVPFATDAEKGPMGIMLRMAAESPNWYEVEINEETRGTKYVSQTNPAWAKTNWEFWLKLEANYP